MNTSTQRGEHQKAATSVAVSKPITFRPGEFNKAIRVRGKYRPDVAAGHVSSDSVWGIDKQWRGWVITHIPTGLAIGSSRPFAKLPSAIRGCKSLHASGPDWSVGKFGDPTLSPDPKLHDQYRRVAYQIVLGRKLS